MQKSLPSFAALLALGSAFAVVAACSSKPPPPPSTPSVSADAGVPEAAAPTADVGAVPEAGAPPFFTGGTDAGAALPAVGEAALDTVIDLAITTAGPKVAPKMEKEGPASRATLPEGQHHGLMVTLQPNRCYTFVATSVPGQVEKLEMKLFAPPLYTVEAGKSGATDKNMPVIGKGTAAMCPILPIAVPYKLDVAAIKGGGRVGVQVFSRAK